MIYEHNFITTVHDARQAPASKPICRHTVTHLGQLPPPKLSKLTAGLSKLSMCRAFDRSGRSVDRFDKSGICVISTKWPSIQQSVWL